MHACVRASMACHLQAGESYEECGSGCFIHVRLLCVFSMPLIMCVWHGCVGLHGCARARAGVLARCMRAASTQPEVALRIALRTQKGVAVCVPSLPVAFSRVRRHCVRVRHGRQEPPCCCWCWHNAAARRRQHCTYCSWRLKLLLRRHLILLSEGFAGFSVSNNCCGSQSAGCFVHWWCARRRCLWYYFVSSDTSHHQGLLM